MFGYVHESRLAASDRMLTEMREDNRALQARYDALLAKYHDVVTAPHGVAPKGMEPRPVNAVQDAISISAGNNGALRRQLGAWARQRRAEGMDEADIVKALLNWSDADEVAA